MTFREATKIALKEMGRSDADIRKFMEAADFRYPMSGTDKAMVLNPGKCERDFIEGLKEMFRAIDCMGEEERAKVKAQADANLEKLYKNN